MLRRRAVLFLVFAMVLSFFAVTQPALSQIAPSRFGDVISRASTSGTLRVLVNVRTNFVPESDLSAPMVATQRAGIAAVQNGVLAKLSGLNYRLDAQYNTIPVLVLEADSATLQRLAAMPEVVHIQEDIPVPVTDTASNNVIGAPAVWAAGFNGTGVTVVVLDTGIQANHPYFGGRVVAEACFSRTASSGGSTSTTLCTNGQSTSGSTPGMTGSGAAADCPLSVTGCGHGTHVSGIVAGFSNGAGHDGVAPGANIIGIKVFSQFPASNCGVGATAPCALSWTSDQLAALNYVNNTLASQYNIASVNMSLGGGSNNTHCDSDPRKAAIDNLRSNKIATVIATGNSGLTGSIGAPACISTSVSVAATDNTDAIALFSNIANIMDFYAPGVGILAAYPTSSFSSLSGTSMATPHVAGIFAVLRQRKPGAGVAELEALLAANSPAINEYGVNKPRVSLSSAYTALTTTADTIGVFRPSNTTFYMRNSNTTGPADIFAVFGATDDLPVAGDWDGNGTDTIGLYRSTTAQVFLKNANTTAAPVAHAFTMGSPGDTPIAGDWDGDGRDSIGVFRPTNGRTFLRNALSTGFADFQMVYGISGDRMVAGDWNGDGKDSPGIYRPSNSLFYLTNQVCNCVPTVTYQFQLGGVGDVPVTGDWDGNFTDSAGVFRPTNGRIFLRNALTTGIADVQIVFGVANDRPVAGKWNGPTTTLGGEPVDNAPEFGGTLGRDGVPGR